MKELYGVQVLTSEEEASGKTIKRVISGDEVTFVFSDGSILCLEAHDEWDWLMVNVMEPDPGHLYERGLINLKKYDEICAEREQKRKEDQTARDKAEFERLKAKLEGES